MISKTLTLAAAVALMVACDGGNFRPAATSVAVTVAPASATVAPGATHTFSAVVTGAADTAVAWSVAEVGGGRVDGGGLYTAPDAPGTFHVVATSQAAPDRSAAAVVTVTPGGGAPTGKWVTAYYAHWLRQDYPVEKIDWSALTHLAVANVAPNADGSLWNPRPDGADTNEWACELAAAARAHGKKSLLMVGGWGTGGEFAAASRDDAKRARFVRELVNFALRPPAEGGCGFDGLDIDWETLDMWDGHSELAEKLVNDLRAAWPSVELTLAVMAGYDDPWYGTVAHLFEQVNIMTYAMSGNWDGWVSWHHAPLFGEGPDHPSSVDSAVRDYVADGVPREKLGIGIGFYGTLWSGGSPAITGPLQPISSGVFCDRDSDNFNTYAHIMEAYHTPAAYRWDETAKMGSLTYPSGHGPANATWISYEDERSIAAKGDYVKTERLGGTIIWLVQHGCTDPATGENPPLAAVKSAFLQ